MNLEQLRAEIKAAAQRALYASAELRDLVTRARAEGFEVVGCSLQIDVKPCMPTPTIEQLQALYTLEDRRQS